MDDQAWMELIQRDGRVDQNGDIRVADYQHNNEAVVIMSAREVVELDYFPLYVLLPRSSDPVRAG